MSLTSVLRTASSGLAAAQTAMRTVSDNIANVNTPGYVRKAVDQQARVVNGIGMGVDITGVRRVTDQYLQLASLTASGDASRWNVVAQYMDNAQSLFGDPSSDSFFFNRLDDIWNSFTAASNDPSSSLLRSQALGDVDAFLSDAQRISANLDQLGSTLDTRIIADVDRINGLLVEIDRINADVSQAKLAKSDASGSENIQSQLLDELATMMNVQVTQRPQGGVLVRTTEGVVLAGDGVGKVTYNHSDTTRGYLSVVPANGVGLTQPIQVGSGEIRGLLDLRDQMLPDITDQLGELVSRTVEQINRAHNSATASPPPATLTGNNVGTDMQTAMTGFTGQTTIAIVDSAGVITRRVDVNFSTGSMTVNGAAGPAFTPANFLAQLNTALGSPANTATFTNGVLSLHAGSGGVAITDAAPSPAVASDKAGRTFSQFFGLNDLIRSAGPMSYDTGLTASSPHGFNAGGVLNFSLTQPDGKPIRDVQITIPTAPANAMSDLLAALNSTSSGVGLYGQFSLDPQGALTFTGSAPLNAELSVARDQTQRTVGGATFSEFFGIGVAARDARGGRYAIDPNLTANPMSVSLARLDLTVASGQPSVRPGDGTGALALAGAGDVSGRFGSAGALGVVNMTLARYAAEFGGAVGRQAATAETRKESAQAVFSEASTRRQAVEGVNIDEELVALTTYQQAFNASARMIQAAKEMFDVLSNMI